MSSPATAWEEGHAAGWEDCARVTDGGPDTTRANPYADTPAPGRDELIELALDAILAEHVAAVRAALRTESWQPSEHRARRTRSQYRWAVRTTVETVLAALEPTS